MKKFNPEMPIFIESESSKIGYLKIPPALWKKMKSSPHFELSSNNISRAKFYLLNIQNYIKILISFWKN